MMWGGLALLLGLAVRPLGQVVGWVAWVFLTYTIGVTRLTYGQVSVLLPGDIEREVEHQLVVEGASLRSTVLKAAHHGGCTSTTQEFLEAVRPEVVVISVGADNDFGHPCADVLERLETALSPSASLDVNSVEGGLPVYRTDEHGTVEIITDGAQVWVETER